MATNTETVCYRGFSAPASDFTDSRQSSTSIRSVRLCTSFRAPGTRTFVTQSCKTEYRD